jgi:uncharacterized membrane protein
LQLGRLNSNLGRDLNQLMAAQATCTIEGVTSAARPHDDVAGIESAPASPSRPQIGVAMFLGVLFIVLALPIAVLGVLSRLRSDVAFQWSLIFRSWISAVFLIIGTLHFTSPAGVIELIPPFIPFRLFCSYASGVLEIALAIGLWTRQGKLASVGMIVVLIAFLPFNIYGWTIAGNSVNYVDDPYYLWMRVPLQAVFIALAYLAVGSGQRAWGRSEAAT